MNQAAIDFLFVLNAAITNIRLYPPASEIIQRSLDRMHYALEEALSAESPLDFAESEKNLLVCGEPLPEKQQQRPQVKSFLSLLLDLGIKSITFQQGVERGEISSFLQILGKTPEQIAAAGGLQQLMTDHGIASIAIDEKVYVQKDSESRIQSGPDINYEAFARYLVGEEAASAEVIEQVREMAEDPRRLGRVFEAGVAHILSHYQQGAEKETLAGKFSTMADTIADLSDLDKQKVLRHIAEALSQKSPPQEVQAVLTRFRESGAVPGGDETGSGEPPHHAAGRQERAETKPSDTARPPASEAGGTRRVGTLKEAFARIMKGETGPFTDPEVAGAIPDAISRWIDRGKENNVEALSARMEKALLGDNPEVRKAVAKIMADIDRRLAADDRMAPRVEISKKLVEWIRLEDTISEEYRQVSERMEDLAKTVIQEAQHPGDAEHILEAYYLINQGNLSKDEAIQALAANMLQNISTDHILDILLKESRTGDADRDDIYSLVILGSTTVERLLDRLRDSQSMAERNRIVQAVSRMGNAAIEPVAARLQQDEPWYYIRNLALLLGRIGNETHLDLLEPLITYPDSRVQVEAVKSIQTINGEKAGAVLLKNIDAVEPQLISYIISVLGALRYEPAVGYLIGVLESKRLWQSKAVREEIRTKACEALGRIQAAEAIAPLERIVRERGLFSGYSENIRSVAAKALANIKRG